MTKVTGGLISIDDSAYDGFKGMTVYGKTVQNLWVNPSGTKSGITATANYNGSVTLSGTANATVIMQVETFVIKPNTSYYLSGDKNLPGDSYFCVGKNGGAAYKTGFGVFTTGSDVSNLVCAIIVRSGITVSGTYRIMLNEGSEAEPWCPPGLNSVGDDGSVKVVTAGKNLLKNEQQNGTYSGVSVTVNRDGSMLLNGTNINSNTVYFNFDFSTPVPPVGTKVVNFAEAYQANIYITYGRIRKDGSIQNFANSNASTVYKISEEDTKFRCFVSITSGATLNNVLVRPCLVIGETCDKFYDMNSTTTTIDLQGHTLNSLPDGTRDELHIDGGGNVVLEKRVGELNSDSAIGGYGSTIPSFAFSNSNSNHLFTYESLFAQGMRVTSSASSNNYSQYEVGVCSDGTPITYRVYGRTTEDVSSYGDIKEKLKEVNFLCLYPLATPQTISLGKISLPKLRKKPLVNNIWANGTAEVTNFSLAPEIDYEYNPWSTFCDGFKTHGKHSYFDMGCCIAARDTGTPDKKSVTATVPYMSGFYDLSKLYGAIAFEARQLMYRLEFVEDSREELQQKKSQFLEWLSQVHDEEIADDDIPGRHFIGSLSEWEFEEGEEGQSGSLEVTFNCQPFLEADEDTTKTCNSGSNTVTVEGQAVNAYAKTSSGTATIQIGGVTQSVGTTEIRLSAQLKPGDNAVTVTGSPVVLRWKELTV